jgi:type I restriction-modification system DNA methylase subunit
LTLQDAISNVLKEEGRPMSVKDLADRINISKLYIRKDGRPIDKNQIQARVRQYPTLFQAISGYVVLVSDTKWKELLTAYWFIADSLKGYFSISELQFVVATLFYFKRRFDIGKLNIDNDKAGLFADLISLRNIPNHKSWNKKEELFTDQILLEELISIIKKPEVSRNFTRHKYFETIQTAEYDDLEFGNIFEFFLNLTSLDSQKSPIAYTPTNLRELMVRLLSPQETRTIYDPVAGTAGLLIEALKFANGNLDSKGTEINRRIAMMGYMNLMMYGYEDVDFKEEDCFEELKSEITYDYIISDLPFWGILNESSYRYLFEKHGLNSPVSGKGFGAIVLLVLSKLRTNGKAVITVSESFLFKKGIEKGIRDLLIHQDLIESIISLPFGALRPFTDAKAAIVILNRNKEETLKNRIKFIQAKSLGGDKNSIDLNTEEIIELNKKQFSSISEEIQIVDTKDLLEDSNLSVAAYNTEYFLAKTMLEEGTGKLLDDLVEIRSGASVEKRDISLDGEIPVVKIENLSKDILDIYLSDKDIISKAYYSNKFKKAHIQQECILVARLGDNLKPTFYKPFSETGIVVQNGVYSLIPKQKEYQIDLEYLYYQLHSSFIKEQIAKRRLGAVIPYISISGLKKLLIPYVDIKSQKEFVQSQKANIIAAERAKVEEKIKVLGYKEEITQVESDIVRTLVHQLRPTLLNIDLELKKLKRIVEKNKISSLKENEDDVELNDDIEIAHLLNTPPNYSLEDIINKLSADSLQLNDVLTTVNKVMSFKLSPEDMDTVDLLSLFNEYIQSKKIDFIDTFNVEVTGEKFKIQINKPSIKELIDQLLINAKKHGFKDSKLSKEKRKVQFSIRKSKERGVAVIEYQNNGESFTLTEKDFITPFEKSQKSNGSGIGGNYIYRIVQAHGGELKIKEGMKTGFSMTIEIPLNQNKDYE